MYVIGVDIGGTTIKFGIFDLQGKLIDKWEINTRTIFNGKYILDDITNSINEELDKLNIEKNQIKGVGVGVPGPVNKDGIVQGCVNLGWKEINVSKKLEKLINLPVKVENDANVAALGEMYKGAAEGYKNVVMITLGTGVGGAIIINNKIVSGSNGAGGEIGHITVNPYESEYCNCGRKGCLEQYVSATGIVRLTKGILKKEKATFTGKDIENITSKDIFNLAKNGDKLYLKIIKKISCVIAQVLANIACICNPDIFIIGGGVSNAGELLLNNVKEDFKKNSFYAVSNTKIELSRLGSYAGIYGAAKLIL